MQRYVSEAIGTCALVFCGTAAIVINDLNNGAVTHIGIAITFGLIVAAMVYSLGDVSGAHINPAVTLAFWADRQMETKDVLPYLVAQILGAFAASIAVKFLFDAHPNLGATLPSGSQMQSFYLEIILTFILMFVIFNVTTGAKEKGITAGAVIGGVVAMEAAFAGPVCGASMNPARSIAPAIVSGEVAALWLYVAAPIIGALLAIPAYRYLRLDKGSTESIDSTESANSED